MGSTEVKEQEQSGQALYGLLSHARYAERNILFVRSCNHSCNANAFKAVYFVFEVVSPRSSPIISK